jgi:Tol biopolymer transport system component
MAIASGTRFGPYEVTGTLGAGGMGEVYRATDTNLKRDVAIKVLPVSFVNDTNRLARFQREAEVLASLNHANIAQIYGLERSEGTTALVIELVEGPTLADRIAEGALPPSEALDIATQITMALESAHEQGIVHRDLKPANVKLRPDGTVKVLDFGIAKALDTQVTSGPQAPALTTPAMTAAGVVLGTAAYMSPEQARGKAVDKRADIWAFGCVLYEMLTGQPAFASEDVTTTLARVLEREPDMRVLPVAVPCAVRRTIELCLRKDLKTRIADVRDVRLGLAGEFVSSLAADARVVPRPVWQRSLPIAAALVVGAVLAGVYVWNATRTPPPALFLTRAWLDVSPATEFGDESMLGMLPGGSRTALEWSPDGQTLAFIGRRDGVAQLYLRELGEESAHPIAGTEGLRTFTFSPDGEWIAFWVGAQIRKVLTGGGPVATIRQSGLVSGIDWGETRIVYTGSRWLRSMSPEGGEFQTLADSGTRVASPFILPEENAVLYTEYGKNWTSGDERVMVLPLATGASPQVLVQNAADARYLPSGHIVFLRRGTLFAAPFDVEALKLTGPEVAVLNGVAQAVASWDGSDLTLAGQFAVAAQGSLAYVPAPPPAIPTSELVSINRDGTVTAVGAPPMAYRNRVEIARDGSTLAVPIQTASNVRLFLYDQTRGTLAPALAETAHREAVIPLWSSDGTVAAQISENPTNYVATFRPGSTAAPVSLPDSTGFWPSSWSPDSNVLFGTKDGDIWAYVVSESSWTQLTDTAAATERFPVISPDGQWLAYVSDVSGGQPEVYSMLYVERGAPVPISTGGGWSPAWNPQGGELFYVDRYVEDDEDWRMMSVDMTVPSRPGKPELLFSFSPAELLIAECTPTTCYSVSPDGQRFFGLRMLPRSPAQVSQLRLVLNWTDELSRIVGTN